MSKLEVNAVEPQCGTNLTLGASGDTIIIPSGATISNQGTAAGFGPTGAVSWDTTKITADPNPAVSGVGYFADTTSAAFTITLPSSPSAGAVVGIADYANTFATNNLTVDRNGSNIGGVAANGTLSTNGLSVTFVYVDATQGWIVTDSGNRSDLPAPQFVTATGGTILTCGDFKTHVFTGPGTFTVSCAGNANGSNSVEYLVVAGGGSGGRYTAGAGGAGGFRQNYPSPTTGLPVTVQGYPITVGAGGASVGPAGPAVGTNLNGNRGSNSIFSTITSAGGGAGGGCNPGTPGFPSVGPGGSGGGVGRCGPAGGSGNTPPVSPSQGNNGGSSGPNAAGGGGGGAGGVGSNGTSGSPGPGSSRSGGAGGVGATIATTFFGPTSPSYGTPGPAPGRYFAGGGAAGTYDANPGSTISGGAGGGGPAFGSNGPTSLAGTAGTANTGGGGGSDATYCGTSNSPGAGGSGIVVIRYKFQ
jgi:hypothetical protein